MAGGVSNTGRPVESSGPAQDCRLSTASSAHRRLQVLSKQHQGDQHGGCLEEVGGFVGAAQVVALRQQWGACGCDAGGWVSGDSGGWGFGQGKHVCRGGTGE